MLRPLTVPLDRRREYQKTEIEKKNREMARFNKKMFSRKKNVLVKNQYGSPTR